MVVETCFWWLDFSLFIFCIFDNFYMVTLEFKAVYIWCTSKSKLVDYVVNSMASSVEATLLDSSTCINKFEDLEFMWGKKRGVGGKRKEVQFYESFTYDGVQYALYDCVYMHTKSGGEPYIGKLIKIWENGDKSKKVKVHWFFRPSEIMYHLKGEKVMVNEIFLASGEGIGLSNVNPLVIDYFECFYALHYFYSWSTLIIFTLGLLLFWTIFPSVFSHSYFS